MTGTLASDGQKFDSSVERGTPFEFRIGIGQVGDCAEFADWLRLIGRQVIEGWDEGVMKMSLGEKATLRIPAGSAFSCDVHFELEPVCWWQQWATARLGLGG